MIVYNEKAPALGGAEAENVHLRTSGQAHLTTSASRRQAVVADLLGTGPDSATTAREIADLLGWTPREVTRQIEKERRAGAPICATCDGTRPGYYLASTAAEIDDYLMRLAHRENEIKRTRVGMAAARTKPAGQTAMNLSGEGL